MKNLLFLIGIITLVSACQSTPPTHLLDPGISSQLAAIRSRQVSSIHYELDFDIPDQVSASIPASLLLEVHLSNLNHPLVLDFNEASSNLLSLSVNGKITEINHQNEHLIIPISSLIKGKNSVSIEFVAGNLSLNRNPDFLYTLLVPDRASTLFPCFDQPDLKASFGLTITAPAEWEVLAGAPLIQKETIGKVAKHTFGKSDLMSTYLFSFVAGKFETAVSTEGFPQKMLYRETNPEKIKASIPEVFKLHQQSLSFLETYTGYSFPFQKMDFAAIPIFQYGGMEHVGAIQYRESALFHDQNATDTELLSRAKLIGHETAHMWFGDLVSIQWFNDVWMKEVFAGFMASKIVNPSYPKTNHDLLFLANHYPSAYAEDRTKGTNPIRQELANLKDAGSLYGSIIYDKAPIMMRQLETAMGEGAFQRGIQRYIQTFAQKSANWNDLVSILDQETELDLETWSKVWVNQAGRPILSEKLRYSPDGKIASFTLSQRAEDGSAKIWPQLFDVTLIYPDRLHTIPVSMQNQSVQLGAAVGMEKPISILYNSNGLGYGVFPFDLEGVDALNSHPNEVMRGQFYINIYENTLAGNIPTSSAFEIFRRGILIENDEILVQLLSGQLNSIFWKFLAAEDRLTKLDTLEKELWQRMQENLPIQIKKSLFGLYSGIAHAESGRNRLYQIWKKELEIDNLKLNPDNYTNLAMSLAVFGHPAAEEILTQERARITQADRLARFDFIRPALSQNPTLRDSVFLSFKEASNREKESWVLTACTYIHHPLHQDSSIKHVSLALEWMEDIQKTGDIFFPKRWASVTIGQYNSPEAARIAEDFLTSRPDFNPILKNKILQSIDNLMRAQTLSK